MSVLDRAHWAGLTYVVVKRSELHHDVCGQFVSSTDFISQQGFPVHLQYGVWRTGVYWRSGGVATAGTVELHLRLGSYADSHMPRLLLPCGQLLVEVDVDHLATAHAAVADRQCIQCIQCIQCPGASRPVHRSRSRGRGRGSRRRRRRGRT